MKIILGILLWAIIILILILGTKTSIGKIREWKEKKKNNNCNKENNERKEN